MWVMPVAPSQRKAEGRRPRVYFDAVSDCLLATERSKGSQAPTKSSTWWLPIERGLKPLPIGSIKALCLRLTSYSGGVGDNSSSVELTSG